MSQRSPLPPTVQYLGIRLTVQCDDPLDIYHEPKDFFPRDKEGGVLIGSAVSCDLQLRNGGVSGVHCRIIGTDREYYLEDANSHQGTRVGQRALVSGQPFSLRDGDVIEIPPYRITFLRGLSSFLTNSGAEDPLESTMQLKDNVANQFLDNPEAQPPQLKVIKGAQRGKIFELMEYEDFFIGREETCQLQLNDDSMSRKHAVLRRDWSGVTIRDLESRNGISVNRRRIPPSSEVSLSHGDQVSLGLSVLLFHDPFAADLEAKLKGIEISDDGATAILSSGVRGRAKPKVAAPVVSAPISPAISIGNNADIREPMSGKWRVSKEDKAKQPSPSTPSASPTSKPQAHKPQTRKPQARPVSKPQTRPPSVSAQTSEKKALPSSPLFKQKMPQTTKHESDGSIDKGGKQKTILIVSVLFVCILVIMFALALTFLL